MSLKHEPVGATADSNHSTGVRLKASQPTSVLNKSPDCLKEGCTWDSMGRGIRKESWESWEPLE